MTRLASVECVVSAGTEPAAAEDGGFVVSKLAWARASIGVAAAMLISDVADAQTASGADDLPQIRVTAPKRAAKRQQPVRRAAPATAAPAVAAPADATFTPVTGDGAGIAGYRTPTASGLSRFSTPLLDTPQTVNVVPQQLIQDQRATSVQEALRNVPGITFTAGEGGVQGDNITVRGYTARNDFYRDGIRDPGWYARDAFAIDSVEVFKGPSSFAFGRGSTGGAINIVSKLPKANDFVTLEGTANSAWGGRGTLDVNKNFGDVATRMVLLGYNTGIAGRDHVDIKRFGVAPSITYKLNDQTKNTLSYIYQRDDNVPDRGFVFLPGSYFGTSYRQPVPVPRNTFFGLLTPGQEDVEKTDAHTITNKFEHEFAPGFTFTNITGYSNVSRFNRTRPVQGNATGTTLYPTAVGGVAYGTVFPPGTTPSDIWIQNTNHFQNQTNNELVSNVSDFNARFRTGAVEHNALIGAEISQEWRGHYRGTFNDPYRINLGNPDPWAVGTLNPTTAATESQARALGLYVQDQVKLTEWLELLGGVRFDNFTANSKTFTITRATGATTTPVDLDTDNNFVTYRVGVVFHPTPNSSVYYMHGTAANPPAEFTTISNGQQALQPVKSTIHEFGAKADFFNGRLNVNAAIFRIRKDGDYENQGTSGDPDYVPVGTTQVQGFEAGISGRLTEQWSIYAGYAYLQSKVIDTLTVANIGHELGMTPKNSFSLFTTYDITPRFTVGGGAFFVDSRWSSTANDGRIPSYWRFDAMASYKVTKNFTMQFNAYNLTDEFYYDTAAGAGYAVPGPGRYFALSGKATF